MCIRDRALAAQLADHTLARTYECLAVGNFREDSGTVDAPIGRHPVCLLYTSSLAKRRSHFPGAAFWHIII